MPFDPQRYEELALLVDGDNLSSKHAGRLITDSAAIGALRIKRVYGNTAKLPGWDGAPGYHLVHSGSGKNSSDILMTVEALDLFHRQGIRKFVLASSDGDFSHLATYLRENGAWVLGIGEEKTPLNMRKSCTCFKTLVPLPVLDKILPKDQIIEKIQNFIQTLNQKKGVKIQDLSVHMNRVHNVKISTLPEKTWRKYLTDRADYFICDPRGPDAHVRLVK